MKYSWDDDDQVYRDEDGHKVRDAALMALLSLLIGKVSDRLVRIERAKREGRIDDGSAQGKIHRELTLAHRMMAALGAGGLRQLTEPQRQAADTRIREQISFSLRFFVEGPYLSDAQAEARIAQYSGATYGTFQTAAQQAHAEAGYDEARRVLDSGAAHCETCPILAERDWVPVDQLVPIGDSECGSNCRCEVEYRRSSEAREAAA